MIDSRRDLRSDRCGSRGQRCLVHAQGTTAGRLAEVPQVRPRRVEADGDDVEPYRPGGDGVHERLRCVAQRRDVARGEEDERRPLGSGAGGELIQRRFQRLLGRSGAGERLVPERLQGCVAFRGHGLDQRIGTAADREGRLRSLRKVAHQRLRAAL